MLLALSFGFIVFLLVLLLGGLMRSASKPKPSTAPVEIRGMLKRLYDERGYPLD